MIQEMTDPSQFIGRSGSLSLAYSVILPAYIVAGIVGFWAFGNAASGNIIENFPENTLTWVTLGAMLFMYSMGCLEANQLLANKVEVHLGLPAAGLLEPKWRGWPPGLVRAG